MKIIAHTLEYSNTARKPGGAFTRGVEGYDQNNVIEGPLADRGRAQTLRIRIGMGFG